MRNPVYEQALTKQGVEFDYVEKLAIGEIDTLKGLRNQARLEMPIDKELVALYREAMKQKADFPPVVLWRPGKGRWIPVDGNQRLAACGECGRKWIDAYLLKTTDQMIADRITWSFNNHVNGKRITPEEALQHAVSFVRKYGMSQEAAAKEWGVSQHKIRSTIRVLTLREKLEEQEVKGLNRLDDEKLFKIAPLEKAGDDVLALGAAAVIENGLTHDQCNEIVKRVGEARTHDKKVEAIVEFTKSEPVLVRKAETKGGAVQAKPLPRHRLADLQKKLWRLLEDHEPIALRPVGKESFKKAREEAQDIVARLVAIYGLGSVTPKEEAV